jgi:hypothetical protein
MLSKISIWKRPAPAILLLVAALGFATARAQSGAGTTNSRASGGAEKPLPGEGRLDQFESDLFGPNRTLNLRVPGTDKPAIQRSVLTRPDERTRQHLDAQKNWAFSGMNDLNSAPTLEQLLGMPELGPDGLEKPKVSAMEQYYNDLGNRSGSASNQLGDAMKMLWSVKQLSSTNPVNPMTFAFPAGDRSMLRTFMTTPDLNHPGGETAAEGNGSSDVSGSMAAAHAAAAADREQKHYADGFKQLLGLEPSRPMGAPASFGDSTGSLFSPAPAPVYNPAPAPVAAPLTPSSLNPVTSAFNPGGGSFHPFDAVTGTPTVNAAGMPFSSTPAALPQPTSPVSAIPIDPFTAYFPKHTR